MNETNVSTESAAPIVQSPPPAAVPAQEAPADPRVALHRLASELMRSHKRRLLIEFLQLRRALR
jgi:hypothetical protein